jgi:hypothetical protein
MEQSPSLETISHSGSQEIPCLLWNLLNTNTIYCDYVGFEVLTAVIMKIAVFWVVAP